MKRRFKIPREGEHQETTARRYVHRCWPEATDGQIRELFSAGAVEADGIVVTDSESTLAPQTVVEVRIDKDGRRTWGVPEVDTLLWGDEWVVVDKPVGIPGRASEDPTAPIRYIADVLGLDRETVTPAWEMPTNAGGPWLLGKTPQAAADIAEAIATGGVQTTWAAITTRPDRPQERWKKGCVSVPFATSRTRQGLAELQLSPGWKDCDGPRTSIYRDLLEALAAAGHPVLGDAARSGYLVRGGIRLRLQALFGSDEFAHSWTPPRQWWPDEPVVPTVEPEPAAEPQRLQRLTVENLRVTPEAIDRLDQRGHPWILRDGLRESIDELPAGNPVNLVGPAGPSAFFALVDGTGPIAARLFGRDRTEVENLGEEIEIRLDEAIGRRTEYFAEAGSTDAFRVVHGEADGLPGLFVDRVGPGWQVTIDGRCAHGFRDIIYEQLEQFDPAMAILERKQPRLSGRARDGGANIRVIEPGAVVRELEQFTAREDDLVFPVGTSVDKSPGLWLALRENRRRAAQLANPADEWLDIRCRTPLFSARLAREGAHTTSVEPDGRYFPRLDATFALNGLPLERRTNVTAEPAEFLEETDGEFDGILVELGAAEKETTPRELLQLCFENLADAGALFAYRSDRPDGESLKSQLREAAQAAGFDITELADAPIPADFPTLEGFPEGDPFEGVWVR